MSFNDLIKNVERERAENYLCTYIPSDKAKAVIVSIIQQFLIGEMLQIFFLYISIVYITIFIWNIPD